MPDSEPNSTQARGAVRRRGRGRRQNRLCGLVLPLLRSNRLLCLTEPPLDHGKACLGIVSVDPGGPQAGPGFGEILLRLGQLGPEHLLLRASLCSVRLCFRSRPR